jgi:hypothetical protein
MNEKQHPMWKRFLGSLRKSTGFKEFLRKTFKIEA